MNQYYMLFIVILFTHIESFSQQENKDHSLWSSEASDQDTLYINPEFLKAIQEGTLINTNHSGRYLQHFNAKLPILSDFSEYLSIDTMFGVSPFDSLSPALLFLFPAGAPDLNRTKAFRMSPSLLLNNRIRIGDLPVYMKAGAQQLFLDEVKDGQRRGSIGGAIVVEYSFENSLQNLFRKNERNKARNRKRESTWKYYNGYP